MNLASPRLLTLVVAASLVGCAPGMVPDTADVAARAATTPGPRAERAAPPAKDDAPPCDVVCQAARVTAVDAGTATVDDAETYTNAETENANQVLSAMHDDFLGCYKARLRQQPGVAGVLVLQLLVGEDGRVRHVEATGDAALGSAKSCIVDHVMNGVFAEPHGRGTLKIYVPLTLLLEDPNQAS